jgi:hypothetical protein
VALGFGEAGAGCWPEEQDDWLQREDPLQRTPCLILATFGYAVALNSFLRRRADSCEPGSGREGWARDLAAFVPARAVAAPAARSIRSPKCGHGTLEVNAPRLPPDPQQDVSLTE